MGEYIGKNKNRMVNYDFEPGKYWYINQFNYIPLLIYDIGYIHPYLPGAQPFLGI